MMKLLTAPHWASILCTLVTKSVVSTAAADDKLVLMLGRQLHVRQSESLVWRT